MLGPCMCGDPYCGSCGPAQGNYRCNQCGEWSQDHSNHETDDTECVHDDARCGELDRACDEAEAAFYLELMQHEDGERC